MKTTGKPWMALKTAIAALAGLLLPAAAAAGDVRVVAVHYDVGGAIDLAVPGDLALPDSARAPLPGEAGAGIRILSQEELGRERAVGVEGLPMVQTGGELGDLAVILWDEFLGSQFGQSGGSVQRGSVTVNGQAQ